MMRTIATLFLWLVTTSGLGRLLIRRATFSSVGEALVISFGIGLLLSSYSIFLFGVSDLLTTVPLLVLISLFICLAYVGWRFRLSISPRPFPRRHPLDNLAAVLLGIVLTLSLLLSLTPEIGKDALIYHLSVPKQYLAKGGIVFFSGNVFASYPLLGEMQYLLALFAGDDILAKMMHFCIMLANIFGIFIFCRSGLKDHSWPFLSMLIFLSIPTVFAVSHTAYNDLFVSFFTLAALYAFIRWEEGMIRPWLFFCALFSGAAASCKYTALITIPIGVLGILVSSRRVGRKTGDVLSDLSLYLASALLAGSPFYIRNWLVTGNPFYPFLYPLFGGRGWDDEQARLYDLFLQQLGMGHDLTSLFLLPWNLSFLAKADSPFFDGVLGPIFLFILPLMIGRRGWERNLKVILVFCGIHFMFWASTAQQMRYLIPVFSLLSIVAGAIVSRYSTINRATLLLVGGLMLFSLLFSGYHIVRDFLKISPAAYLAGNESRNEFLRRLIPPYQMYQYINTHLPPQSRVLLIYMKNMTYLCETACHADSLFEAHTLQKILRKSASDKEVGRFLREAGFTHLLYDETYLLSELSPLTQQEMTLFNRFREGKLVTKTGPYRLDRVY